MTVRTTAGELTLVGGPYVDGQSTHYVHFLPWIVLCDVDGIIALNNGHRGHYEWDKVSDDEWNWPVIAVVRELAKTYQIVFLTSRMEQCREATEDWIQRNVFAHHFALGERVPVEVHMRADEDYRPDFDVKGEMFDQHIRDSGRAVLCVLDDHDSVVAMWRKMGLTCLQVAPGDF